MILPDHQIRFEMDLGSLNISPTNDSLIQPASVDLRLGNQFIRYVQSGEPIDPEKPDPNQMVAFEAERFVIRPGEFVLGTTMEWVGVGETFAARVEGKSTLGRLGLIIHSTAGFIDPGFQGTITLEMTNINSRPIVLRPAMRICQIAFYRLDSRVERPYGHEKLGSHYHRQNGVTPAAALTANKSTW